MVVAFAAIEVRKGGFTGEHTILKTFENVVSIQKKGTQKKKKERSFFLLIPTTTTANPVQL